jgi:hypothetical protein
MDPKQEQIKKKKEAQVLEDSPDEWDEESLEKDED